ncbi:GTP cyclohydrolase II RibA [Shewanella colwelliana]|uniref:GTP cyclohydrolase II RibA n=1 Tax=Shewanella colwelliana TaxID=23 RepID=UPI00299E24FD|nr:GTP cyclohydrolase II RibA [Shewanella colwelliana]MDX1279585.1 GTP cyclohydrolase II RibA [Shewanella colwelliana]
MFKSMNNWCDLPTPMGTFRMYDSGDEGIRIISYGDIYSLTEGSLLRMHSSCLASEVFGATDCDCADQLREAMKLMAHEQGGLIVHLHQEGRGQGLARKIEAVHLMQYQDLDTYEAFEKLKYEQDIRTYFPVVELLKHLDVAHVRLLSNNPRKIEFLQENGLKVTTLNTHPNIRPENAEYLETKNDKLGHTLPLEKLSNGNVEFYHSDQPWGGFSNFSQHAVYLQGKTWRTTEHFYQAQKFTDPALQERIRRSASPMLAKEIASQIDSKHHQEDWNNKKEKVMWQAITAKFSQHPELKELLLSTDQRNIAEHTVNDSYWGDAEDGSGLNRLGELLMQLRSQLRNNKVPSLCAE